MNAALYARVSTRAGSQNPDMQLRELREYCKRRGWGVAGEYVDAGVSGTKEQKPELDRLLGECRKRRVDAGRCQDFCVNGFRFFLFESFFAPVKQPVAGAVGMWGSRAFCEISEELWKA